MTIKRKQIPSFARHNEFNQSRFSFHYSRNADDIIRMPLNVIVNKTNENKTTNLIGRRRWPRCGRPRGQLRTE